MNAAAYLAKFGWKAGSGLGKDGTGIKTYIHAAKKDDNRGLGSKGKEVGLAPEWDDVFKRAAANVNIEADDEGIKLKSVFDDTPKALVYDRFRRGTTQLEDDMNTNEKKDTHSSLPSSRASPTSDSTGSNGSGSDVADETPKQIKKKAKKAKRRAEEAAAAAAEEEAKKAAVNDSDKPKKRKRARTCNEDTSTSAVASSVVAATTPSVSVSSSISTSTSIATSKKPRGRPGRPLPDSDSDEDNERQHLYHGRCQGKLARLRSAEAAGASSAAALLAA